jgi:hypothetical protein
LILTVLAVSLKQPRLGCANGQPEGGFKPWPMIPASYFVAMYYDEYPSGAVRGQPK